MFRIFWQRNVNLINRLRTYVSLHSRIITQPIVCLIYGDNNCLLLYERGPRFLHCLLLYRTPSAVLHTINSQCHRQFSVILIHKIFCWIFVNAIDSHDSERHILFMESNQEILIPCLVLNNISLKCIRCNWFSVMYYLQLTACF